jgi:NAD(P)-dependent dehydrogenase (short-subunit alcohol dehydrogenase family)
MTHFLQDRTILVTGASGGIGRALVAALLAAGARQVIGASTRPAPASPGYRPEIVDVRSVDSVRGLARRLATTDLSVVVHCAGVNANSPLLTDGWEGMARDEMEVNYFGLLHLASAFAPLLQNRPGASMAVVLSFLSHVALPEMATYCASKAAAHSLTESLRSAFALRGIRVCGIYPMAVDTTMSRDLAGDKLAPAALASAVVEALERGAETLYPGPAAAANNERLAALARKAD